MTEFKDLPEIREKLQPTLILVPEDSAGEELKYLPVRAVYAARDIPRLINFEKTAKTGLLTGWNTGPMKLTEEVKNELRTERRTHAVAGGESYQKFLTRWLPTFTSLLLEAAENPSAGVTVARVDEECIKVALAWLGAGGQGKFLDDSVLTWKPRYQTPLSLVLTQKPDERGWRISRLGVVK